MEAKPIKDRKGYFCLYDSDGDLCGRVNTEAGRAIIGRAFYHKVRTCRVERVVYPDGEIEGYMCAACGYSFMPDVPNYCPNCGAKVVE